MAKDLDINVHHLTRVEGHGNIVVRAKDGNVEKCVLEIVETPRVFESMIEGLNWRDTSLLTCRICGICSVAHTLASVQATEVRRRLIEALSYSSEETVAGLIQAAYEDADEGMRVSAVFSMGRSADDRWAREVVRELSSANPEMRYEAARACGELALEEAACALVEMLDDVDLEVQEAAIWSLGQIGGGDARKALKTCLRSDNEAIREAARAAMRELEFMHGDLGSALFFDLLGDDEADDLDPDDQEEESDW